MISCKEYVAIKKAELKEKIATKEWKPRLCIFKFGNDASANSYIKGILRDCSEVGIDAVVNEVDNDTDSYELNFKIIMATFEYDGIIIQSPLPWHINRSSIDIPIYADVDGWGKNAEFEPCTPLGVVNYLKYNNYNFEGKDICVVGRSEHVGKPLARMLTDLNATVTLCHSKTKGLIEYFEDADLIITAIDKVEYFDRTWFMPGDDVIDIGLGLNVDGKLKGNLTDCAIKRIVNCPYANDDHIFISGTGGVGLLTRLELLNNTYKAFCMQRKGV